MKNFKLKIKLLLYGFPFLDEYFAMDNFELKKEKVDFSSINDVISKNPFIPAGYIYNCTFRLKNDENIYYSYFESIKNIEYTIPNNEAINKESIMEYFSNLNNIEELINNFKKKLRLIFNLRIIFPISEIIILDENNKLIDSFVEHNNFPAQFGLDESFDKEQFAKNSRVGFNLESFLLTEKNNVKFSRAISLFNDSFDSSDISIRYLLLFSCLESLFLTSKKNITENLALCTSRIFLYENPKDEEELYRKIKNLYNYRCKFIHGQKTESITYDLEMELRKIVRYVLLIYWHLCLSGKQSNQIIKILKNKEKISLQTKIYANTIRCDNYEDAYRENLEMIGLEISKGNVIITEQENGVIKAIKEI